MLMASNEDQFYDYNLQTYLCHSNSRDSEKYLLIEPSRGVYMLNQIIKTVKGVPEILAMHNFHFYSVGQNYVMVIAYPN